MVLSEGQAVVIPPGMTHEFWAETGQYGECIYLAFGQGAQLCSYTQFEEESVVGPQVSAVDFPANVRTL